MDTMTPMNVMGLVGTILVAIVSIGLFATKSEVEKLRAELYQTFAPRTDISKIYDKLDTLQALVLSLKREV